MRSCDRPSSDRPVLHHTPFLALLSSPCQAESKLMAMAGCAGQENASFVCSPSLRTCHECLEDPCRF